MLALGSNNNSVRIINPTTGDEIHNLEEHTEDVNCVCFSPNGLLLASGSSDTTIIIWDCSDNYKRLFTLLDHDDNVNSLSFSPDGRYLASGSNDCFIKVWDCLNEFKEVFSFDEEDEVIFICFSSGSGSSRRYLAYVSNNRITIRNGDTFEYLASLSDHNSFSLSICFSSDARILTSGFADGSIVVYNMITFEKITTMVGCDGWVRSMCFFQNDKYLVSGSYSKLKVWDMETFIELVDYDSHSNCILSTCISHDNRYLVSASFDTTINIWDCSNFQVLKTIKFEDEWIQSVCFQPEQYEYLLK